MAGVPQLPKIDVPVIDRSSGLMNPQWYRLFEVLQGIIDENDAGLLGKASDQIQVLAGNGLEGGGTLENDLTLAAKQDTGWTEATGTVNKGVYASYGGQAVSVAYVQAEAQATDDAVKNATRRILALEDALRNNGGIDG